MNATKVVAEVDAILLTTGQALKPGQLNAIETALAAPLARDLAAVQDAIGAWQLETFGSDAGQLAIMATHKKLEEEARELMLALAAAGYQSSPDVAEELADVLIVLLGLATKLRIDAYAEITYKMMVNRARRWPAEQAPGQPVNHLKDEPPERHDRLSDVAAEAFERSISWSNAAAYHRAAGEGRAATYAERAATGARRYSEVLNEQLEASKAAI